MTWKYQEGQQKTGIARFSYCSDVMPGDKITLKVFPECFISANINDCAEETCSGNGECVDGINDYTCECIDGYEGKDCGSKYALILYFVVLRRADRRHMHSMCFPIFFPPKRSNQKYCTV